LDIILSQGDDATKKTNVVYGGSGSEESTISVKLIPSPRGPAIAAELLADRLTTNTLANNSPFVAAATMDGFSPAPRIV
jgi:hypothetical protein